MPERPRTLTERVLTALIESERWRFGPARELTDGPFLLGEQGHRFELRPSFRRKREILHLRVHLPAGFTTDARGARAPDGTLHEIAGEALSEDGIRIPLKRVGLLTDGCLRLIVPDSAHRPLTCVQLASRPPLPTERIRLVNLGPRARSNGPLARTGRRAALAALEPLSVLLTAYVVRGLEGRTIDIGGPVTAYAGQTVPFELPSSFRCKWPWLDVQLSLSPDFEFQVRDDHAVLRAPDGRELRPTAVVRTSRGDELSCALMSSQRADDCLVVSLTTLARGSPGITAIDIACDGTLPISAIRLRNRARK